MQVLHAAVLSGTVPVQYPIMQSLARNRWIDVNNESAVTLTVSLGGRIYLIPPNTTARYAMDNTETSVSFTPNSAANGTTDTVSGTIYNEQDSTPVEVERGANASDILPITSAMIADGAVTAAKVATDAINAANIVAGAVGNSELASLAVANANIQANAVAASQIASGAVTTTKIANLAVTTALIAGAAVGTAQIANAAITTALIANLAVTNALINDVSASKITAGTISATISITSPIINGGTITGATIQTASSGGRWVLSNGPFGTEVLAGYPNVGEINPAKLQVLGTSASYAQAQLLAPLMDNGASAPLAFVSVTNYVHALNASNSAVITDGFGEVMIQGGVVTATPPIWRTVGAASQPAFQNSWANFGSGFQGARFCRDAQDFVHIEGLVTNPGALPTTTIFTLPLGYQPTNHQTMVVMSNGTDARLDIDTSGNVFVSIYGTAGNSSYVSLNVSFSIH